PSLLFLRPLPPTSTLFPYTTLFRSNLLPLFPYRAEIEESFFPYFRESNHRHFYKINNNKLYHHHPVYILDILTYCFPELFLKQIDRKSTRLNSSHVKISYAVLCLKK